MEVVGIKQRFQGLIVGISQPLIVIRNDTVSTQKKVPYIKFTSLSKENSPTLLFPSAKLDKKQHIIVSLNLINGTTSNKHPIGQLEYLTGLRW